MSSQPSTPRPTMGSPRKSENEMPVNHNVSPILPLESQKQSPVTPNPLTYSPSSSLAVVRKKRNDSLGPNDGCPSFGSTEYAHNVYSLDRHTV
jgi:hypothetical protein